MNLREFSAAVRVARHYSGSDAGEEAVERLNKAYATLLLENAELRERAEGAEERIASVSGVTREQLVAETKRKIIADIRERAISLHSKGSRELLMVLAEQLEAGK